MLNLFMGNAMWQLIQQSDAVSKGVMLLLFGMSIVCWTVFFYKLVLVRIKQRQLVRALTHLQDVETFEQLLASISSLAHTMPGYFLTKNLTFLKGVLESNKTKERTLLTAQQWQVVEQMMQQVASDMIAQEESDLAILSMSASVSPLLGLFGTVWGLVHAFIRISEKQTADIATVAPGIAEALMTTLAGLMVAIPALVMYHYLHARIMTLEQQVFGLADRFGFVVQKLFAW